MRKILISMVLGLSLTVSATAGQPEQVDSQNPEFPMTDFLLANLQNSQTLRIEQSSQGCFHSDFNKMDINQRSVKMVGVEGFYPDYALTNAQLTAIDKHIYFLAKNGGEGGCTTSQQVKLSIVEDGVVIKSSEYSHNWCRYSLDWRNQDQEMKPMDFSNLSYKIQQISKPITHSVDDDAGIIDEIKQVIDDQTQDGNLKTRVSTR